MDHTPSDTFYDVVFKKFLVKDFVRFDYKLFILKLSMKREWVNACPILKLVWLQLIVNISFLEDMIVLANSRICTF